MTQAAYKLEAIHMLTRAELKPTEASANVLAADLKALAVDELDAGDPTSCIADSQSAFDAMVILKDRIGGLKNLRGYVEGMMLAEIGVMLWAVLPNSTLR
jgi:hypothetical protein